ncbi:MAG: hypothetical protein QNJ72_34410 [Pleurocapsa sp. MO_226.B13]|nr:hypothetical protein [Pleurocapsa sp. MO_226.B13]
MQFSQVGRIALKNWQDIPNHFNGVCLDEYVIMPNHIHGIIIINRPNNVETRYIASLQSSKFAPLKPGSLQTIVHAYKASVTRWCRRNDDDIFRWQPRFYDRIIRNGRELNNVRQYIINNPVKWTDDENYVN